MFNFFYTEIKLVMRGIWLQWFECDPNIKHQEIKHPTAAIMWSTWEPWGDPWSRRASNQSPSCSGGWLWRTCGGRVQRSWSIHYINIYQAKSTCWLTQVEGQIQLQWALKGIPQSRRRSQHALQVNWSSLSTSSNIPGNYSEKKENGGSQNYTWWEENICEVP